MKNIKKFISLFISIVLMLSLVSPVFAEEPGSADETGTIEETESVAEAQEENDEAEEPEESEEASIVSEDEGDRTEESSEQEAQEDDAEVQPEAALEEPVNTVFLNYGSENQVGFTDLLTAAADAQVTAGSILTITADQELKARLAISKNLTIQDDGTPRTIYVAIEDSSSTNGRGIQVNAGATVTLRGTAYGYLTICGRSMNYAADTTEYLSNYLQTIVAYNGTFKLENLNITECDPVSSSAAGAAVYVRPADGGKVLISNCSFSSNSASGYGADIYVAAGDEDTAYSNILSFSGAVQAKDVSYNLTNPIVISSALSSGSSITLHVPSTLQEEGAQVLSGSESAVASAPGCVIISGLAAGLKLDTTGYIAEKKVAAIGSVQYSTLADAVSAAKTKETITLIDDAEVDARIAISSKSLTITDDGNAHTIYVYNTERASTYGRGIQLNGYSQTLNITATQKGNITILGHSPDGETINYSGVIVANGSTINLNNIILKECSTTNYGAIYTITTYTSSNYRTGTVNLNNCTLEDNTTLSSNGGAAVYNRGRVNINSGTVITGNCATSTVSGAIFNDIYEYSDTDTTIITAVTTIGSGCSVYGNYKNCSNHEDFGVAADGKASDIYASDPESISLSGNPDTAGIDYEGNSESQFGVVSSGTECGGLFSNEDATLTPIITDSKLYWGSFFTLNAGSAASISGLSYSLSGAEVEITGASGAALTVSTDCGSLNVPWGSFSPSNADFNLTRICVVNEDGSYAEMSSMPSATGKYAAVSIYAAWNQEDAQNFIRSLSFTTPGSGMTQKVTIDVFKSADEGTYFYGGSSYSYVSGSYSASRADTLAREQNAHLAVITDKYENAFIKGSFGAQGWLGGVLSSDRWYWVGGKDDGLQIAASSNTNRGYEGTFVSWAEGEPSNGNAISFYNGLWYSAGAENARGFYLEAEDANAATVSTTLTSSDKAALRSMSIDLESGFYGNYFFFFPQQLIDSDNARVDIQVGSGTINSFLIKDVAVAENMWDKDGSYKITVPFSAREMNADVIIRVYDDEGKLLRGYGGSGADTNFNLRWYAETVILKQYTGDKYNAGFSEDLVNYVKAMLNYGAAAQLQFMDEPGELANEGYEYTGSIIDSSELEDTAVLSHTNSDVAYKVSLIAGTNTAIRLYPVSLSDFSATVDNVSTDTSGNYVEIEITPDKLTRTYTVYFSGSFSDTVSINALGAISGVLSSSDDENARTTADRLYRLSLAAGKYFGVYTPAASAVEALVNTAYAYLAKTQNIQYDQHKLTGTGITGHSNSRRQLYVSPEDISSQNTVYMDCSSFVWNVYRDVFGEDKVESALGITTANMDTNNMRKISNDSLVQSYTSLGPDTINNMFSVLQPGDLIVKYSSTKNAGHVVFWTGNGYIHCTGASYSFNDTTPDSGYDKTEDDGAIHYVSAENFKASWYNGYDTVVILRPLNVLGTGDILSAGTLRQQTGAVAASKTAVSGGVELFDGQSVTPGAEIIYTIKLENPVKPGAMNVAYTVTISDTIPEGAIFSGFTGSYTGSASGSSVTWTDITVNAGASVELKYSVTVSASAGTSLTATDATMSCGAAGSSSGTVSFSNCDLTVESDCSTVIDSFVTLVKARKSQTSAGLSDINTLLTNKGLGTLCSSDSDWISGIFGQISSGKYYYVNPTDSSLYSKLVSNFASGRSVLNYSTGNGNFDTDTRVRNINEENLRKGDIIAVYNKTASEYRYYVYCGSGTLMTFIDGENVTEVTTSELLPKLLNMTCFAIFRMAGR